MNPLDQHLSVFKRQASDLMQTIHAICSLFDVEGAGVSPNKRIAAIQRTVCEYYDLPLSIMSSRIRTQRNAQARHVALYLSRELTKLPLETIASAVSRIIFSFTSHANLVQLFQPIGGVKASPSNFWL